MILKATKKPVTVDCVKWDGTNNDEIINFCGKGNCSFELDTHAYDAGVAPPRWNLTIHTLEGNHFALEGDYIIKGVKGEFYPCKPDIFEQTYNIHSPEFYPCKPDIFEQTYNIHSPDGKMSKNPAVGMIESLLKIMRKMIFTK